MKQMKRIARKFEYINNQRQKLITSLLHSESLDTMRQSEQGSLSYHNVISNNDKRHLNSQNSSRESELNDLQVV